MTTVTVVGAAGKRLTLDAAQTKLFENELRRVQRFFPSTKGIPQGRIAPDCVITVEKGKRRTEYLLYGRAVLMNRRSTRKWQFYFGVLLLEWLG